MSNLVVNERIKLTANALDRASTASLTVGVLAPVAAGLYSFGGAPTPAWLLFAGAAIWLFASGVLHFGARTVLGGMKHD